MSTNHCSRYCKPEKICGYCRLQDGWKHTSTKYNLEGLDADERMLLFLYACGKDISDYFDERVPSRWEMLSHRRGPGEIIEECDFSSYLIHPLRFQTTTESRK
jgi:hypothetical protein